MHDRGFTLLELMVVASLGIILATTAVPFSTNLLDRQRTVGAASYLSGRLMRARFEAVKRSRFVAVQFALKSDGYWIQTYVDGNGNGVLARDIARGVDTPLTPAIQLEHEYQGVKFGICQGVTAVVPGDAFDASDPIQIGQSTLMSFNPNGSSTGGTLYIRGTRSNQVAVRVLGATARSRVFQFDFGAHLWTTR